MLEKNELFSQHIEQHPRVAHSQQYGYDLNGNIVDIRYNTDGRKLRT